MPKPTTLPLWATGATINEPQPGVKTIGHVANQAPPANDMNWIHNTIYEWNLWLDGAIADDDTTFSLTPPIFTVGDTDFGLRRVTVDDVRLNFDTTNDDYIRYDRAANRYDFFISNDIVLRTDVNGFAVRNGIFVGDSAGVPEDNDVIVQGGIAVGHTSPPVDSQLTVGDVNFGLQLVSATDVRLNFDAAATSYFQFDRTATAINTFIGATQSTRQTATVLRPGANEATDLGESALRWGQVYADGGNFDGGMRVGFTGQYASTGRIEVGDTDMFIALSGGNPEIRFDSGADSIEFIRASNRLLFRFANTIEYEFLSDEFLSYNPIVRDGQQTFYQAPTVFTRDFSSIAVQGSNGNARLFRVTGAGSGSMTAYIPLNIPNGGTLDEVSLYVQHNSTSVTTYTLERTDFGTTTVTNLGSVVKSTNTLETITIGSLAHTIDPDSYYYISITSGVGWGEGITLNINGIRTRVTAPEIDGWRGA